MTYGSPKIKKPPRVVGETVSALVLRRSVQPYHLREQLTVDRNEPALLVLFLGVEDGMFFAVFLCVLLRVGVERVVSERSSKLALCEKRYVGRDDDVAAAQASVVAAVIRSREWIARRIPIRSRYGAFKRLPR